MPNMLQRTRTHTLSNRARSTPTRTTVPAICRLPPRPTLQLARLTPLLLRPTQQPLRPTPQPLHHIPPSQTLRNAATPSVAAATGPVQYRPFTKRSIAVTRARNTFSHRPSTFCRRHTRRCRPPRPPMSSALLSTQQDHQPTCARSARSSRCTRTARRCTMTPPPNRRANGTPSDDKMDPI